jgi:hypothetical protein
MSVSGGMCYEERKAGIEDWKRQRREIKHLKQELGDLKRDGEKNGR